MLGIAIAAAALVFHWLDTNASGVQALASIATVAITLALAWITRQYVALTQELAVAAREQLRLQQQNERSDAVKLLTLIEMFLGTLSRLPVDGRDMDQLRDVSVWRHSDVRSFTALAAVVIGASPPVHQAIQGLNVIRAKVDGVRSSETPSSTFAWDDWSREVAATRSALRTVRNAVEAAEATLAEHLTSATAGEAEKSKPPPFIEDVHMAGSRS